MLVDGFRAIVYLRPLRCHYRKLNAYLRVSCNNCLRGHRLAVEIAKYHAFSKICSELLVVFVWFISQSVSQSVSHKMDSRISTPPSNPTPDINAEWIYETYKQQQQINANIQQTNATILELLKGQSQPRTQPEFPTQPLIDTVTPPITFRPKHVLPQPEYSHLDPSTYPQFRGLLAQKLRVDALACGDTEQDRV
jgi:hypothetical protein